MVLGDIRANVPNQAAGNYKAKELLTVSNIVINGNIAPGGDTGYEPYGSIHGATTFEEATEMLFITHGPILFFDDQNNWTTILDSRWIQSRKWSRRVACSTPSRPLSGRLSRAGTRS